MATTPLNVSLSDSKPQTEAQAAGIEMQARLPAVDSDDAPVGSSDAPVGSSDAPVGSSDAAAGLADAQVQPSVFVASESPGLTPSDAAEADKRMLDAIGGALEQGPRAVVEAMWMALPRGKAYDEIYEFRSDFKELPVSAACAMNQSLAVISKLMRAFPDHAMKEEGFWNRIALHWAAQCNSNVEVIVELLKAYPEAARIKTGWKQLPLHVAVEHNSNLAVITELLKAYPEAAREKDDKNVGRLPLRIAAERTSNAAVIAELLKAYPEAAREKDKYGCLPLHVAAEHNSNAAVIAELLKAYPEAAREKDKDGRLPLRIAAEHNSNAAVIAELLKAYPEAAREKDRGQLPLHWAASNNSNAAVIVELVKAYPKAAREKDNDGRLPLHVALWSYSNDRNAEVIAELLKAYPDPVLVVDGTIKASLNTCLPLLSQTCDLPRSIINNAVHPLFACIKLSAYLFAFSRSQRSKDIRLANDADEKAAELEQLACAIIRNREDSSRFGQEMDDCLQLAADLKMKFFISEPACSRRIEELWWMDENFAWETISKLLLMSFFWLFGLNFVFHHENFVPPPLVRFLMNRASYFAFLVCLLQLPLLAAPGDPVNSIGLEIFLAYWLFDICFAEAAEFLDIMQKHRLTAFKAVAKYAEDPWNVYDVVTLSAAVAAAVVRGVVYAGVGDATAAASNQLCAWALALLWGRLVNVLSVVSFVGPLLIMVLVMVFRDLSKFALLVVLMELPFVAALHFLESGDGGNEAFATFPDSALSFFKIVIGQGPDVSSVTASSSVLLSVGSVLLSVLLLNLLIAMFSKTFDTIVENSTQEYLLQKAQLTFTWARAPRMPPPLACALALKDWIMYMVSRHVRWVAIANWCGGWDPSNNYDEDGEWVICPRCCTCWEMDHGSNSDHSRLNLPPLSTFDRMHFFTIAFPRTSSKTFTLKPEYIREECEAKYEAWCKQVMTDLEENAEYNSEAQMDKFKSRMLRGMETTVESGKDVRDQVKALSDAVQSQHAYIQQLHASMQLILQKHNP
jgi:ankyrin repeat protein